MRACRSVMVGWLALLAAASWVAGTAQDVHVKVSATFKGDGVTEFATIQNALDHAPEPGTSGRLFIHIDPGTYRERLYVSQFRARTTLLGSGKTPSDVIVTAGQNASSSQSTFFSETVEILADEFQADNLSFENTAGSTGQALAVSVTADRAIFKHCRFLGFQDTLFANYGRQYYVNSYIAGAVDFIFGNAAAVFEDSEIHVTRSGYVTAQSRISATQRTGYVFLNSKVTADDLGGKTFSLGRPWRAFARVVFINTELPASLDAKGWSDWGRDLKDVYFAERGSIGPGARTSGRASWSIQLSQSDARQYQPKEFLAGQDHWDAVAEAAKLP